jgi:hypothetical protein
MRGSISRRLGQLEQKAHITDAPQPVIFVTSVSPGKPCLSNRAECDDQAWERAPRETQQDFVRRVREDLKQHEDRPTVVIFRPEDKPEAERMA